jgi:dolichol-phosphate mannosyltransferase
MKSHNASNPELSLIVPTYNESENIKTLVERVHKSLSDYNYELIVVDDNSPDGTAELAKSLSSKYPIQVIVRTNERGLASAVVAGFKQSKGDILGVIDADLQHPPEFIPNLMTGIKQGADVVIASRYIKGGAIEGWTLKRKIISVGAKIPASVVLSAARKIKDPLSGFFLFRKEVIEGTELSPTGYKILLEVLVKGKPVRVVEVPYTFKERERGKSNLTAKEQINYLKHLYQLARYDGGIKRFLKFCVVGASGTGVNLGLLALFVEIGGLNEILSVALSYEISIITNFILNDFWTFSDRRTPGWRSFLTRGYKFNLVSLVGWGINLAVFAIAFKIVEIQYILSEVLAIACAMLWNFFANVLWTWRVKPKKEV